MPDRAWRLNVLEPSKEDLEKAHKLVTDYFCFHEKDLMRNGESNDYWIQKQTQDIAQALAELRAEGERKYQSVKDEYVCELNKTQNEWEAEKSALEERVKELESDRVKASFSISEKIQEITRLKAKVAELEAENGRLAKNAEDNQNLCQEKHNLMVSERSKWASQRETIHRLTSALGAANHSLAWIKKLLPKNQAELDNTVKNRLYELSHYLLVDFPEAIEYCLSDTSGSVAFEKWKKMEAVVEAGKNLYEHRSWESEEAFRKALEALDAKGEGK